MSWTDERVETLKKMWGEGQSASQIAKELGGVFAKVNVADPESVKAGFEKARAAHGQERVLVNCAGINLYKDPFDFSDEDWEKVESRWKEYGFDED